MSVGEVFLGQTYKVSATKNNSQIQRSAKPEATSRQESDGIEISDVGRDLNVARKASKNAPDIRENIVNEIKAKYQSGQYEVNTSSIADKLLGDI